MEKLPFLNPYHSTSQLSYYRFKSQECTKEGKAKGKIQDGN